MSTKYQHKIELPKEPSGRRHRKTFYSNKSKADAKRKAEEWLVRNRAEALAGIRAASTMLFSDWAEKWLEYYKKPDVSERTYLDTYEFNLYKHILPAFGDMMISEIKPIHIKTFLAKYASKSKSLKKKLKMILSAIFEDAIDNELITSNPCRKIKITGEEDKRKETYTAEECRKILDYADTHRFGLAISIMLQCGLRPSELLALRKSDFDLQAKTLTISKALVKAQNGVKIDKTKTKKSYRTIPIPDRLAAKMATIKGNKGNYLFLTQNGTFMDERNFTHYRYDIFFRDLEKDCGIRRLPPYSLRHTCATVLYEQTGDIFAVSKYLGHANITVTSKTYVHENVEALRRALF